MNNVAVRILEIDVLRSLAIILIILSHIDSFTNFIIFDTLDGVLAFFGLSIFFFISGFLMRFNNEFNAAKDIYSFFKNRASKIYPLYWFSIAVIYVMSEAGFDIIYSNDIAANKFLLILNVLGLQGLFSDNFSLSVWWFVGVILLYYFLFSVILYLSKNTSMFLTFSFLAVLPLLFLKNEFNLIHSNVFSYYFIFIAGILSATAKNLESLTQIAFSYTIFLLMFIAMSFLGINTSYLTDVSKRDIVFFVFTFIFTWYGTKFSFENRSCFSILIKKLADSSYSLYLFHIPVLTAFKLLIPISVPLETFGESTYGWFILFSELIFTLLSGYYIMVYFNKFCVKYVYKKRIKTSPKFVKN